MARDTRSEILKTAQQLFNERGYHEVTTRDIAETLGISKGNLTYHFKKKEEIIEALLSDGPPSQPLAAPEDLAQLNAFFEDIQRVVHEFAFYFWHHAQLAETSATISNLQRDAFANKSTTLASSLRVLQKKGLVRGEGYEGEYACAINAVMLASIYWVPYSKLRGESLAHGFLRQAWAAFRPLLSAQGLTALQALEAERDA